jgi:hypothetical protein
VKSPSPAPAASPTPTSACASAYTSGTAVEVEAELSVYEGRKGTFGDTLLRGNFKTRGWALRRQFAHKPGASYNRALAESTRDNIEGLGVAESVEITPYPVGCELDSSPRSDGEASQCVVHQVVEMRESKDYAMALTGGLGFATLDPFYLFLTPSSQHVRHRLGLRGPRPLRLLDQGVPAGVPFLGDCAGAALLRAQRPRQPRAPADLRQPADPRGRRHLPAAPHPRARPHRVGDRHPHLLYRDQPPPAAVLRLPDPAQQHQPGRRQARLRPLGPEPSAPRPASSTAATRSSPTAPARCRSASPTPTSRTPSTPTRASSPTPTSSSPARYLGGIDWFLRADLSFQHFIPIPRTDNRLNFRYSLRYGQAIPLPGLPITDTSSVPEIWRYFGGGTVDLGIRGLLPETMLVDIEPSTRAAASSACTTPPRAATSGPSAPSPCRSSPIKDFLGGNIAQSLFFDFGVLAQKWSQLQFSRDFRRSVGINFLKWDIKFVTLALGYAVLIPNAIAPGNVKPIDDRNGRFIFDVGVTF